MPSQISLKQIHYNMITVFSYYFNLKIANKILELFKFICKNQQITDIESMKNEIDNIVSHIYSKTHDMMKNTENCQFILANILKHVLNGKTLQFIQKQSNKPNMTDEPFINQFNEKMREIFMINGLFESKTANKIVSICYDYMKEQQFDNIDRIKDDLEDVGESEILQAIFENINGIDPNIATPIHDNAVSRKAC